MYLEHLWLSPNSLLEKMQKSCMAGTVSIDPDATWCNPVQQHSTIAQTLKASSMKDWETTRTYTNTGKPSNTFKSKCSGGDQCRGSKSIELCTRLYVSNMGPACQSKKPDEVTLITKWAAHQTSLQHGVPRTSLTESQLPTGKDAETLHGWHGLNWSRCNMMQPDATTFYHSTNIESFKHERLGNNKNIHKHRQTIKHFQKQMLPWRPMPWI